MLTNGYRNWRLGTNLEPASRVGPLAAYMLPHARQILDRGLRNLSPPRGDRLKLLDVGFGSGDFMRLARSAGWTVYGVDPDPVAVSQALERGFNVRQGDASAFDDCEGMFDRITLGHVLEHVHDPKRTVRQLARLLKPGGKLWIDTPNLDSLGHARFGRDWYDLDPPRHLVLFNWDSLEALLEEGGLIISRRFVNTAVFAGRATASRLIKEGRDPHQQSRSETLSGRLLGLVSAPKVLLNHHRSELIMLEAEKAKA